MITALSRLGRTRLILLGCAAVFVIAAIVLGTILNNAAAPGSRDAAADEAQGSSTVPTAQASSTPAPVPSRFAPVPPGTKPRTSTEVQAGTTVSKGLPPSQPVALLLTGPAPKSGSVNGSLVSGFPRRIPVATGSKVATSSVSSSRSVVQVSLVARTTLSSSSVARYYERAFTKLGLPTQPVAASPGSKSFSFTRGKDTVTVTVTPASGGSRYSLFGVLHVSP